MMTKDVRWEQRFQNFEKAFLFLQKAREIGSYDKLQAAGLVQSFEFTFELAWKTLKDYLELQGIIALSPRDVIKQSFATHLIEDGHLWIEMLDKRNQLTHTYNEQQAEQATVLIREKYFSPLKQVYQTLKEKCSA